MTGRIECPLRCFSASLHCYFLGRLDSLESSFISNSDSGLDDIDTTNELTNNSLPLSDAIAKNLINPEVKSWKFIEEEAPLIEFINAGALTDKAELLVAPDTRVPVSIHCVVNEVK